MNHLNHINYLDSLSHKQEKLVYQIHFHIMRETLKHNKTASWTKSIKSAIELHKQVRKTQEKKRIKNKQRNSKH